MIGPLITPAELLAKLDGGAGVIVLDVRWRLGAVNPRGDYDAAHLPGALYVDLEHDLSGPPDPAAGRHPLPSPERFATTAAGWGVRPESSVIVYDDNGGMSAARAWWLLRWIGHQHVQVLDGGLGAWRAAGGPVTAELPTSEPAQPVMSDGRLSMPTVDADEIGEGRVDVLLDARANARFRGDEEPIDRIAGHIPGALCAPTSDNLSADGRFRSADELRSRFSEFGVATDRRVAVYCGSGVTAAHEILALEVAGIHAELFAPSWSGWIADPRRPVATGD